MTKFDRHDEPDPDLVQQAGEAYARLLDPDLVPEISWSSAEPLHRATSMVIPIEMRIGADHAATLYFKSFHPARLTPETLEWWHTSFVDGVERDLRLVPRFQRLAKPNGIDVRQILAFDPDRLMLITLGVRGNPLGKVWRYAVGSAGREEARDVFPKVGQAMKLLELASEGEDLPNDFITEGSIAVAAARLQMFLSASDARDAESKVESLYVASQDQPGQRAYFAHGDIDASNVLVDEGSVNLIDFAWVPRPVGFDISRFLLRMDLESPRISMWTGQVSRLVVDGYGAEGVIGAPSYILVRVLKLVGLMHRFSTTRNRRRFTRARALLRHTLSST